MIDLTNQMRSRISDLDVQNQRISYQMSTGKVIDKGSDDSVLYSKYLDIEDNLRVYEGLEQQINKTTAQNNVADSTTGEIKKTLDSIKVDLLKSLNSGMTKNDMIAVATNLDGMRETLVTLANTTVDGEYLFTGSDTTKQTFKKDPDYEINGKIDFGGNAHLRDVAVEPGVYRERGVTAHEILMYNTDTSANDDAITFTEEDIVVDQQGNTWKFVDYDNDGDIDDDDKDRLYKINENGRVSDEYLKISSTEDEDEDTGKHKTYTTETISDAKDDGRISPKTASGLLLETKHNVFDDLNIAINALKGYKTKLNGEKGDQISYTEIRDQLSQSLGLISQQYDATNIGHAELGGRNKIFETELERIDTKVTHYNILMQKTNGADMAKLAMESKSLELTYNALYSTVAKMNKLSLVNFIN